MMYTDTSSLENSLLSITLDHFKPFVIYKKLPKKEDLQSNNMNTAVASLY